VDVFNKDLCDVIEWDTLQRDETTFCKAVIMSFHAWGVDDCVMTLAIHESKVEYLANSCPEFILKGVQADVIMHVLGPEIYATVMASKTRAEELAHGVEVPQGVSMIIPVSSSGAAVIILKLEAFSAVRIGTKIFQ